jgi:hypothetical protein
MTNRWLVRLPECRVRQISRLRLQQQAVLLGGKTDQPGGISPRTQQERLCFARLLRCRFLEGQAVVACWLAHGEERGKELGDFSDRD